MCSPATRTLLVALLVALTSLKFVSMVPVERPANVNDAAASGGEPISGPLGLQLGDVQPGAWSRNRAMSAPGQLEAAVGQQLAMATSRPYDRCGRGGPCPNRDKMCAVICKNNPSEGGKVCNCDTYALRGNQRDFSDCNRLL